jgi:hypothetical protein
MGYPLLAQGCRSAAMQQVGSYLGYTGRGANAFRKAARDPEATYRLKAVMRYNRVFRQRDIGVTAGSLPRAADAKRITAALR